MTNPNEPAFPLFVSYEKFDGGLTKREYFAAMAMQAIVTGLYGNPDPTNVLERPSYDIAKESCQFADALIIALNKPE